MLLAHLKFQVDASYVTVLATHVKPVNKSIVKRFLLVGVEVKEQSGMCVYSDCLDQSTNQKHICSLAEEKSLKWRRGKKPANRRVNVLSIQSLRMI